MSFSALTESRDRLAVVAAEFPAKMALVDDRPGQTVRTTTFRELNAYVNRIAHGLLELGFKTGERLVWAGRSSIEAIAIQHAVRKAGGYSIALNHALTHDEIHTIIRVADATFVFAEAAFREMFAEDCPVSVRSVVIFDGEPLEGQHSLEALVEGISEEELSPRESSERGFDPILSFTSGTTGLPKGVVRHTLGAEEMKLQSRLLGSGEGRFIVTGSLTHSGPNGFANNSLLIGNTVILQRRFDPEDWLRLVSTYQATTSYSAPYMMRRVCALSEGTIDAYDRSSLGTMIAAAAQWPFELKEAFTKSFPACDLWEIYGATELGSVTVMEPQDQLRKPGSCGRPVTGVEIRLLDELEGVIAEADRPGVLYARSDCVAHDFLGAPDAFQAARRGSFMTAGDIAYRDSDDFYFICDREKDMVISAGVNIYPREIENVLERHPAVFECAVIGLPDEEWGERLHAIAVSNGAVDPPASDSILDWCRERLAGYKIPRTLKWVDELPHTLSGKIDKKALRREAPGDLKVTGKGTR